MTHMAQLRSRRLLSINNYFYRRGGAETVFLEHNEVFTQAGWDVIPFAMRHPENMASAWSEHFVSEIEYGRDTSPWTKLRQATKIIYSMEARRHIGEVLDRAPPAVAHAHNVYHHISPSIFSTLKAASVPTVMTAHDLKIACPAYQMLANGRVCEKCRGGRVHNVLLNRCVKGSALLSGLVLAETIVHRGLGLYRDKVDRIVTPSRFYRDKLIAWGWEPDRLVHIPNFIDAERFRHDWIEGDYFVFAGRLAPEKGLRTLVRAAALSGQRVVIAGTGPEEPALRALASELGADVRFAGYVAGDALHRLIGEARALVLPSEWYENAPMSVLEAYALGIPVIGAAIGGIPELIAEGATGLLAEPGDVADLARALSRMAELSPASRVRLGASGRDWVSREFTAAAYRDRMLTTYDGLGAR